AFQRHGYRGKPRGAGQHFYSAAARFSSKGGGGLVSLQKDFVGYEYQEITAPAGQVSFYLDCYENFGWQMDGNVPVFSGKRHATLRMKRDRKLIHKMELTRLQRHFEACAKEIEVLEKSKTSV